MWGCDVTTLTLAQTFDMNAFDFGDIFNGTVTSETSTEIDYTGVSGTHYVFKGINFGGLFENLPINGVVTDFSIVGSLDLSGSQGTGFGAMLNFGWEADGLLREAVETGTSGNDGIAAGSNSIAMGEGGDDTIDAVGIQATLIGGAGDDVLSGFASDLPGTWTTASYADAAGGVTVNLEIATAQDVGGGLGHDTLTNIAHLIGSKFDDTLHGDDGDNTLNGGRGVDHLTGGSGDDLLLTHSADSVLIGGPGFDTVRYVTPEGLSIDMDNLPAVEKVIGSSFDDVIGGTIRADVIQGGDGNDTLSGDAGRDTLRGGAGDDTLDGGTGADIADYAQTPDGVHVDLRIAGAQFVGASAGTDTLVSIEGATGSAFDDTLVGNSRANHFNGGFGNDTIDGRNGNDVIEGGSGADVLTGGSGADTFVYVSTRGHPSNVHAMDLITDFDASVDRLMFSGFQGAFVPGSLEDVSITLDSANLNQELQAAVGNLHMNDAALVTATGGTLAGHVYLVVNASTASTATILNFVVIEFGPGSNLTGFSVSDFI